MENNTKIAIGLAAAVVVGYIVYNSKKPKAPTQSGSTSKCTGAFAVECNDGSCDVGNGKNAPCLGERGGVKGTKANPECICESYPCNCGGSTSYGYDNSLKDNKGRIGIWDLYGIDFSENLQRSGQI